MFLGLLSVCRQVGFRRSLPTKKSVKCLTLNNQPCQNRATLVNINPHKTFFYTLTVGVNKRGGSCNTINDLYARVCVPNKVNNMRIKFFNIKCN